MADNKINVICPACGEFMKKIYINSANVSVDVCVDGCGGIWFDNKEINKFDEQHECIDDIKKELEHKNFVSTEDKDRWCPICAVKMVKNGEAEKQGFQIDECYHCGGIFLDYQELEKIRANVVNGGHLCENNTSIKQIEKENLSNLINKPKCESLLYSFYKKIFNF